MRNFASHMGERLGYTSEGTPRVHGSNKRSAPGNKNQLHKPRQGAQEEKNKSIQKGGSNRKTNGREELEHKRKKGLKTRRGHLRKALHLPHILGITVITIIPITVRAGVRMQGNGCTGNVRPVLLTAGMHWQLLKLMDSTMAWEDVCYHRHGAKRRST
jgi:hypothetical protein